MIEETKDKPFNFLKKKCDPKFVKEIFYCSKDTSPFSVNNLFREINYEFKSKTKQNDNLKNILLKFSKLMNNNINQIQKKFKERYEFILKKAKKDFLVVKTKFIDFLESIHNIDYEEELENRIINESRNNLGNLKTISNDLNAILKSLFESIQQKQNSTHKGNFRFKNKQKMMDDIYKDKSKLLSFENLFEFFTNFEENAMDLVTSKYLQPDLTIIEEEIQNFKQAHFSKLIKSPQMFTSQILNSFLQQIEVVY